MGTMIAMVVALWGLLKALALATINYDDGSVKTIGTAELTTAKPGRGRSGPPLMGNMGKTQKVISGTIAFDASYPTGGEDISDIFGMFGDFGLAAGGGAGRTKVLFEQPLAGAQTGKFAQTNYATRKVQLFVAATTEALNASDQSAIAALPFIAIGPR